MSAFIENDNTTYYLQYVITFCARYRRKVFDVAGVKDAFLSCCDDLSDCGIMISHIQFGDSYVTMTVSAPPDLSPHALVIKIKKETTGIKNKIPTLSKMPSLWTKNYMISTCAHTREDILRFVNRQKYKP